MGPDPAVPGTAPAPARRYAHAREAPPASDTRSVNRSIDRVKRETRTLAVQDEHVVHVAFGFAERAANGQPHPQPGVAYLRIIAQARRALIDAGIINDLRKRAFDFEAPSKPCHRTRRPRGAGPADDTRGDGRGAVGG